MRKTSIFCIALSILLLCLESKSELNSTDGSPSSNSEVLCSSYVPDLDLSENTSYQENKILSIVLWVVFGLVSVFCNILIIHVVRVNSHMHTTTNFLIVNMALCDFITTIASTSFALKVVMYDLEWRDKDVTFGKYVFCRIGCTSYMVCMLCSTLSLVVITFDRFLAVTRPLKYQNRSSWTKYIIAGIWLVSFAIPANYVINKIVFCSAEGKFYCLSTPSPVDAIMLIAVGFVFTHVVIVALYGAIAYTLCKRRCPGEQKTKGPSSAKKVAKKVTRMIVCILVAFEISWCPVFFGYILPYLYFTKTYISQQGVFFMKMLAVFNGIFNAIIYAIFNENFRKAFQESLRWKRLMRVFKKGSVGPKSSESSAVKEMFTSSSIKSRSTTLT